MGCDHRFRVASACSGKSGRGCREILSVRLKAGHGPGQQFDVPVGRGTNLTEAVELRIERVGIGAVKLNGVQQLQGAELQADWDEQGLAIRSLTVRRDDVVLELAGRLLTKADWPLALEGTAAIRSPNAQPWALKFEVDGELREHLMVDVQSQGYLDAKLSGWVRPLEPAGRGATRGDP